MNVLQRLMRNSQEGTEVRPGLGNCRNSTYAPTSKGHVMIHIGNRFVSVARAAWEAVNGPIADPALLVCHKCDNPICINVNHMFLGTHIENMRDMKMKNRASRVGNPTGRNQRVPQDVATAILADTRTQREIANQYSVSTRTVRRIQNGQW